MINFAFEIFELDEAITPYGSINTKTPDKADIIINQFNDGEHFRTAAESDTGDLILQFEDRLLTIVLDESGSMTWNDVQKDRYAYLVRLLTKLRDTYPGSVTANLIGFGGVPIISKLVVSKSSTDFLSSPDLQNVNTLLQERFQDSIYDFAGVRVVRRTDRYPNHPADGVIVAEGILDAVKDDTLSEGQRYYYGVWTFNKDLNFSEGRFISGIPRDRILPKSVNSLTAVVRILPGVQRDQNTKIIYSFLERSGTSAFDSSGNGNHGVLGGEVVEDNFWLGDAAAQSSAFGSLNQSVGVRFDGEMDFLETDVDDTIACYTGHPITINFWIYRYPNSAEESWILGTGTEGSPNIGWALILRNSDGAVGLKTGDISNTTLWWDPIVPAKTWTMVTVSISTTSSFIFINGEQSPVLLITAGIDTRGHSKLYTGGFPSDTGNTWAGSDFFGSLNQVSIHDVSRSDDYITALYESESAIFQQPLQEAHEHAPDNSQREVLLTITIGEDYDYEQGSVEIRRKYRHIPEHIDDGESVVSIDASPGQFYYLDTFDFINNADYYYRAFTINAIGNNCDRSEARSLAIHIPATPLEFPDEASSGVSGLSVTNGDKKILLQWSNPDDSQWIGTRIYFGAEKFPTISTSSAGEITVTDGFEIFDTQDKEFFVHRKRGVDNNGVPIPLENNKFHFYTVVTYNRLGQISDASFIVGVPSSSLETIFPPADVNDLHLTIVNPRTLSVQWESPVVKTDNLELFFGETALIFVSIKDIFGGALEDLVTISLQVCTRITERELTAREEALGVIGAGDALDGPCGGPSSHVMINGGCSHGARFAENCNTPQEERETVLNYSVVDSGLIKGILSPTSDPAILARRDRYEMSVRARYRVVDPETNSLLFELNTEPSNVSFQHPLEIAILNRDNRTVFLPCSKQTLVRGTTICTPCGETGEPTTCDTIELNGAHINATRPYVARVELQFKGEALPPGTPIGVSVFKTSADNPLTLKSDRVKIKEGTYNTSVLQQNVLDHSGNATGAILQKSVVDIEIPVPTLEETIDLYVSLNYLGFFVDAVHTVKFIGSLFIKIDSAEPRTDGIHAAEQFASVWTIDPNDPLNTTSTIPVPDGTLVKWELVKLRHGKDRPFYSTEPINELVNGVYSTTNNGIARNVFFGPISNVESHSVEVCGESCCLGEEYAIKATVILEEQNATDAVYMAFPCVEESELSISSRLFINAAASQPGDSPNYITWADGESLLKFGIAQNPAIVTDEQLPGSTCFRQCSNNILGGRFFTLPDGHIITVTAPGEILWNVKFGGEVDTGSISTTSSTTVENISYRITDLSTEWEEPSSWFIGHLYLLNADWSFDAYLRFVIDVPAGHDIQSANIIFTPEALHPGSRSYLAISLIEPDGLPQDIDLSEENSGTILSQGIINELSEVDWQPDGTIFGGEWTVDVANEHSTTTDLSDFIQAFINKPSYSPGSVAIFHIRDKKPLGSTALIQPYSMDGEHPPRLTIESAPPLAVGSNILSAESVSPLEGQINATAGIPISGDVTDFYVRLNKFVDDNNPLPQDCESSSTGGLGGDGTVQLSCEWKNDCHSSSACSPVTGIRWNNVRPVNARTTIVSDDISVTLMGGGDYEHGVPPVMVGFKEPLDVNIVEARVNGRRLQNQELVVDGVSQHTIVVEVKFAGEPVPDGTPLELLATGTGTSIVRLSNCQNTNTECFPATSGVIFTTQVNDPFVNPTGDKRSLAYFSIDPLPNIAFYAKINVTCRYDKLGTAIRSITRCVEVNNTVNVETRDPTTPQVEDSPPLTVSVASNEMMVYDSITDTYAFVTGSVINRMGHFSATREAGTSSAIYLFGGYTDHDLDGLSRITATVEKYDIATDTWSFLTDMPTSRTNGMTVLANDYVYCIGGLELNPITNQYVVSRKIESFDLINGIWNPTLTPMPQGTGIAFGIAEFDGTDNIYVLCGITAVNNNNQPSSLNEVILRYTISSDTWTEILPSDSNKYQRVSPFGFLRTNPMPYTGGNFGYIYSGSVPKSNAEINAEFNQQKNQALANFRSFILTSTYYLSLTESEQTAFIQDEERKLIQNIQVPPYLYLSTGFKYTMGSEEVDESGDLIMDISDDLAEEWRVLPKPRDRGQTAYIPTQDAVYFLGGANQNQSTTLNRVESILLENEINLYSKLTSFSRGRSLFSASVVGNEIYLCGGLTSGHNAGFVHIDVYQSPSIVEAQGNQSSGIVVTLRDDAGELINNDVRCLVRGRIRVPEIDDILTSFLAKRAADRALGGDGTGNAPSPQPGEQIDYSAIIEAQNSIVDPNSDQFQFNAAKKLDQQVFLFPVLYSQQEFVIQGGVGGTTLLPRSEDPLADFQRLAQFIDETLAGTPPDPNERFQGDLTREELAALGDVLKTIELPPVVLDSNTVRNLYQIETVITILDDVYFGQTVSDFDLNIQQEINRKIEVILTPPEPTEPDDEEPEIPPQNGPTFGGIALTQRDCLLLQHVATPEISNSDQTSPNSTSNTVPSGPANSGGPSQSGQCLFCKALFPLKPAIKPQLPTVVTTFYNANDWVPQIKYRLTDGHSLDEVLEEIDIIDYETPFGASQVYTAIKEAAKYASGDTFEDKKKVIYVVSDNSENFSLVSRNDAVAEVNAVDGDRKTPIVYTVFSTSFPTSVASQLERTETADIEFLTTATGGQSSTLISSGFLDQILNLTIGGASGGLGWGRYINQVDLGELSAITDVTTIFDLPSNTNGYLRFRYSEDGFNFTDWTEKFEGSQTVDFVDFFASLIEFEVTLISGFTSDITPEYDSSATGIPRLQSITWGTSAEREDFIFLQPETVLTNVQQLAACFEGTVPSASTVEIGVATSLSSDWRDYQNSARPAIAEFGKTILLDRSDDSSTIVPLETLTTRDGLLYKSVYGSWDPNASIELFRVTANNEKIPVLTGFRAFPRQGEIYFDARQPASAKFTLSITNNDQMRVGIRLRNRLHTDSISLSGFGYIYSTNDTKPIELSQVAPRAINAFVTPQNPTSADTFFAMYDYIDLNGDAESGSLIKWFKNGSQLFELNNKSNWTNNDLQNNNKLEPNDKIYFSITPSDGRNYGTTIFASPVTVNPLPPIAQNLTIIATRNDLVNSRYDTASTYEVQYTFRTNDRGENATEFGTTIKWYVNGFLFKEGTFTAGAQLPQFDPRKLAPNEVGSASGPNLGMPAHRIGNEVLVEVTPRTRVVTGQTTISEPFIVVNSVPVASNVVISPDNPSVSQTLVLSYEIDDPDIDNANETQTDQSTKTWLVSTDGTNFTENSEAPTSDGLQVPPVFTERGQKWKVRLTPFDGLDLGQPVESNTVTIS